MKDLSLFLLKNSFGAKMIKKSLKNFCNGENSTSILGQQRGCDDDDDDDVGGGSSTCTVERPVFNSPVGLGESQPAATLEEMIMQLEMEEKKMARKSSSTSTAAGVKVEQHRMSCVNSSDILRSARNALNQYPRFSLDGRDAMYRCSFTKGLAPIKAGAKGNNLLELEGPRLPEVVGGESVVWCKPGVIGKLMGLEAMPVPLNSRYRRERLGAIIKRQNLMRKIRAEERRHGNEMLERKRRAMAAAAAAAACADRNNRIRRRAAGVGSCSRTDDYCLMRKPTAAVVGMDDDPNMKARWPVQQNVRRLG